MRPSLVLLPGSLCDRWIWSQQIEALSDTCSSLVPQFLELDSLETMAHAVLRSLPERFLLCGHAMGGRVALEIFRLVPERVLGLALLATTVHPARAGENARRQTQIDLAFQEGMGALAAAWLPKVLSARAAQNTALMQGLTEMYCRFTPDHYRREVQALLNRPDPLPLLPKIACPTLVLCGREDPLCTPAQAQSLAAEIRKSQLSILDDCGHFPTLEQPERVAEILAGWLRSALPDGSRSRKLPEGASE
jgi:pimeloyl-ACP methyl ester carboxylesterase